MSHFVALPWGMGAGSLAAAGGCGRWRAGVSCGVRAAAGTAEGACSQGLPPVVAVPSWTVRGRL